MLSKLQTKVHQQNPVSHWQSLPKHGMNLFSGQLSLLPHTLSQEPRLHGIHGDVFSCEHVHHSRIQNWKHVLPSCLADACVWFAGRKLHGHIFWQCGRRCHSALHYLRGFGLEIVSQWKIRCTWSHVAVENQRMLASSIARHHKVKTSQLERAFSSSLGLFPRCSV